jgi:hypothetical protein
MPVTADAQLISQSLDELWLAIVEHGIVATITPWRRTPCTTPIRPAACILGRRTRIAARINETAIALSISFRASTRAWSLQNMGDYHRSRLTHTLDGVDRAQLARCSSTIGQAVPRHSRYNFKHITRILDRVFCWRNHNRRRCGSSSCLKLATDFLG